MTFNLSINLNKKLKIALLAPITHEIPPIGYGPWELVVYNLAESLVKLNVDVTLFATKQTQTAAKLDYCTDKPLIEVDQKLHQSLTNKHISYTLSKSANFDMIHNHLNIHPVLHAKKLSIPMITTLHGSASEKSNEIYYMQCKQENFVSISFAERNFMPHINYVGNVYNGVDFTKYKVRKNNEGKYFVFSGRIVKEKGILSAIELSRRTKIPLKIAGIITDQIFFDEQIKPCIDNINISFLGNLNYDQIVLLLQHAIASLCLVEWDEPFGLSALDSLACGVPVIATKKGAFPELVYDDGMGILVGDVDEAIGRLGEIQKIDSAVCSKLAEKKFSRETMAQNYLNVYLKLFNTI
jgi:glycosyltransferase involved in cell wall biosynthesis